MPVHEVERGDQLGSLGEPLMVFGRKRDLPVNRVPTNVPRAVPFCCAMRVGTKVVNVLPWLDWRHIRSKQQLRRREALQAGQKQICLRARPLVRQPVSR
jgi:hypothetical protein